MRDSAGHGRSVLHSESEVGRHRCYKTGPGKKKHKAYRK